MGELKNYKNNPEYIDRFWPGNDCFPDGLPSECLEVDEPYFKEIDKALENNKLVAVISEKSGGASHVSKSYTEQELPNLKTINIYLKNGDYSGCVDVTRFYVRLQLKNRVGNYIIKEIFKLISKKYPRICKSEEYRAIINTFNANSNNYSINVLDLVLTSLNLLLEKYHYPKIENINIVCDDFDKLPRNVLFSIVLEIINSLCVNMRVIIPYSDSDEEMLKRLQAKEGVINVESNRDIESIKKIIAVKAAGHNASNNTSFKVDMLPDIVYEYLIYETNGNILWMLMTMVRMIDFFAENKLLKNDDEEQLIRYMNICILDALAELRTKEKPKQKNNVGVSLLHYLEDKPQVRKKSTT